MPKAKQSARPAESGWLLEVGVIGIDKTLKLLKLTGWSLLEVEQTLRPWCIKGVKYSDKAKLPWLTIPPAPWEGVNGIDFGYYEDVAERLFMDLEHFEKVQRGRGRGPTTPTSERPSLTRWILDAETLKLFGPDNLDNDTQRKKLERIKAHSIALGGALKEIAGKGRAKSKHYPKQIAEIIRHSKALPTIRKQILAKQIARAESSLKEHDAKRILLCLDIELLRERWKKAGKISR